MKDRDKNYLQNFNKGTWKEQIIWENNTKVEMK